MTRVTWLERLTWLTWLARLASRAGPMAGTGGAVRDTFPPFAA